jgi:hypothetical protein
MGEWLLYRRDRLIVARHEVPGSTPPQKSGPVGYGVIRAGVRADSMIGVRKFQIRRLKAFTLDVGLAAPDHTVPYGTVLLGDAFPSTSCLATIMLSLWDNMRFTLGLEIGHSENYLARGVKRPRFPSPRLRGGALGPYNGR